MRLARSPRARAERSPVDAGASIKRDTARTRGEHAGGRCRTDLYGDVTRRVIAELEAGRVPWVQPWGKAGGPACGLPRNALTQRTYSGVNVLILWGAVIERGYPSQNWLTFRQALDAGGAVRRGERGTTIVYADRFTPDRDGGAERGADRAEGDGERRPRGETDPDAPRSVAFLKRFTVFNAAQIDGLPERLAVDRAPLPEREIVPAAEAMIAASGVPFRVCGDYAFYSPREDFVQVPPQPTFFDQINYYRTCLHELTHATGHASRLGRDLTAAFGSTGYAREELVAEMGSAFLCAALGIVPTVRHADYIGGWLDVLRDDLNGDPEARGGKATGGRAIFRAASAASKAAEWLLARRRARDDQSRGADA